jgi:AcrR family transcriptional regulator
VAGEAERSSAPTRREPVQRRSRERVEVLLRAAEELLAQGGVDALTTRRLAEYTGIPVATIYRYFDNRDAIIAAYLDRELEQIERASEEAMRALPRVTFRSMTEAVALAHLHHHQAHPEGIPVWFGGRINVAVRDSVRELDRRMASKLTAATLGADFLDGGPHFGAGLIVRLFDRMFQYVFEVDRSPAEQEAIVLDVIDMIASYMERTATHAGLEGISAEEFLPALRGSRRIARRP